MKLNRECACSSAYGTRGNPEPLPTWLLGILRTTSILSEGAPLQESLCRFPFDHDDASARSDRRRSSSRQGMIGLSNPIPGP